MDGTIAKMNKKVNKVLHLFQDTLLYSSKTYYQEEIYKREKTNKAQKERILLLEKKQKLLNVQKDITKQQKKLLQDCEDLNSSEISARESMTSFEMEQARRDEIDPMKGL